MTPDRKIWAQEQNAHSRNERVVASNNEVAAAIRNACKPGWIAKATFAIAALTLLLTLLQILNLIPKISN